MTASRSTRLVGGVAVVTGGAGTAAGLGQGLVRELASAGMRVAILDRDGDAAAALADELRHAGIESTSCAMDVRDDASIRAAVEHVESVFGGCNVLCAHVGGAMPGRFDAIELSQWRDAFDVGVIGTVATVQAFLPLLRTTEGLRRIVLTSSVAALAPGRFQGPYRAAKVAVTSIGETLDLELGPEGIGTTVAFPSGMASSDALVDLDDASAVDNALDALPAEFREVAATLAAEFAGDPLDLAAGGEAAAPIISAVLDGRRYVVTHGVSAETAHRARHDAIDDAFAELRARGYRPVAVDLIGTNRGRS